MQAPRSRILSSIVSLGGNDSHEISTLLTTMIGNVEDTPPSHAPKGDRSLESLHEKESSPRPFLGRDGGEEERALVRLVAWVLAEPRPRASSQGTRKPFDTRNCHGAAIRLRNLNTQ